MCDTMEDMAEQIVEVKIPDPSMPPIKVSEPLKNALREAMNTTVTVAESAPTMPNGKPISAEVDELKSRLETLERAHVQYELMLTKMHKLCEEFKTGKFRSHT